MCFSPCLSFSERKTEADRGKELTRITHQVGGSQDQNPQGRTSPGERGGDIRSWTRGSPPTHRGGPHPAGDTAWACSLSASIHRCITYWAPDTTPCLMLSMTRSRDSPCVCSSGPPHSPLLTHLTLLFHRQTLGLERHSNWLAVSSSWLPSLPKQTALFVLSASHQDLTVPVLLTTRPPLAPTEYLSAREASGKLLGQPLTTYPSNTTFTFTDEIPVEGEEWPRS